jgi:photosystem II stability/assembly factor-like uncharacterized protein
VSQTSGWFGQIMQRSDDGGKTWKPATKGLTMQYELPDKTAEVGHCVHRSDDAGENWHKVSGNLPTDFGFPIEVHAHEPNTIYVVPIKSDSEHYPPEAKLRVYRSHTGGDEWVALTKGLPQENGYVNILRDAMAVDAIDKCGIYFGTTGGQVCASADYWRRNGPTRARPPASTRCPTRSRSTHGQTRSGRAISRRACACTGRTRATNSMARAS